MLRIMLVLRGYYFFLKYKHYALEISIIKPRYIIH